MKKTYLKFIAVLAVMFFGACGAKDAGDDLPGLSARITVNEPSNHANFFVGDSIWVKGQAVDDQGIKALSIKVFHSQYDTLISNIHSSAPNLSPAPFSAVFVPKDTVELNAYFLVKSVNSVEEVREERVSFHIHKEVH